jgi:serine phosphatase RsbU (regulator of sigma subunit)
MIGAVSDIEFKTEEITLSRNDRIILYSDGLIDFHLSDRTHYTEEDLINEFNSIKDLDLHSSINHIIDKIELLQNHHLMDDITLLGLEYL